MPSACSGFSPNRAAQREKGREQLVVQIVAVGDDNQRRVGQRRVAHQTPAEEGHQQGFSRTLGVPHYAAAPVAAPCRKDRRHTFAHRVELMVASDFLDRAISLVFEHGEPTDHL